MRLVLSLSLLSLLTACAHWQDVRPGADGVHRVVIQTDDTEKGQREAIEQAGYYCKDKGKEAAFVNESSKYTGDLDESTYKTGKRLSKVAQTVGGTVWAMGAEKESNVGGIAGLGGTAADQALGKGYTVDMRFKCQ